ncbi:cytochrome P450 [Micromonospora wenchangensis]|uniref:cytochrome P450 n=1 Tax=Micromonospora wenchangensis TaxID=1185415 RepID=UPI0013043209|nr:cytochrome P450 [Micromonospora wenchangensis]
MIDLLERFGSTIYSDPHGCYSLLRSESPVQNVVLPDGRRCHLVLDHAGARLMLSSNSVSNQRPGSGDSHMLESDDPRHSMLRQTIAGTFSKSGIRAMTPAISHIVDQQLALLPEDEDVDLVPTLARVVPVLVTARLLGILPEDEPRLSRWTTEFLATDDGARRMAGARAELTDFISQIFEKRHPVDGNGLIGDLLARPRRSGVTDDDLIATITLLVVAGHEATVNLITNAIWCYLSFPHVAQALAAGTADVDDLIAETLRFQPPLTLSSSRYLTRDLELSGTALKGDGQLVIASFASANRDEAKYENPDLFLLGRRTAGHLGFGSGAHRCLGDGLAIAEARCVVGELIGRFPDMSHREETRWRPSCISRSQHSLVVRLDGGAPGSGTARGHQRESRPMQNSPEVTEQIRSIVLEVLHDSDGTTTEADLELDTDLRGYLGFDSLSIMYVLSTAEERFGVTLGDAELMTSTMSVRVLASYIEAALARQSTRTPTVNHPNAPVGEML